jgi:hypothetical protein
MTKIGGLLTCCVSVIFPFRISIKIFLPKSFQINILIALYPLNYLKYILFKTFLTEFFLLENWCSPAPQEVRNSKCGSNFLQIEVKISLLMTA